MSDFNVEVFAKMLHEAGASAVKNGSSVNPYGDCYDGWDDISEAKREGRRIQARWLMDNGIGLVGKANPKAVPPRTDVSKKA